MALQQRGVSPEALGALDAPSAAHGLEPLKVLLAGYSGALRWPLCNNLVGSINNKIKVIKHMALASTMTPTSS